MCLPRRIIPGATLLVTRRCAGRMFLLTPSVEVCGILLFCLCLAASRHGIVIHAFAFMSNHYHIELTDPLGRLPLFMADANRLIARILNAHHGRSESFFAPGSYDLKELIGAEPQLDAMVYIITNPVRAGLVRTAAEWPGLVSLPEHLDGRELRAQRPDFFFRKQVRGARRAKAIPETAAITLRPPPAFADIPLDDFIALLAERVAAKEAELCKERRGRFLGAARVRKTNPFDAPQSKEHKTPRRAVATNADRDDRRRGLAEYRAFHDAYCTARIAWAAGDRDALFPYGTFLLKYRSPARIEGPPETNALPP